MRDHGTPLALFLGLLLLCAAVTAISCGGKDKGAPAPPAANKTTTSNETTPPAPPPPPVKDVIELQAPATTGPAPIKAKPAAPPPANAPRTKSVPGSACIDAAKYPGSTLQDLQAILHAQVVAKIAEKLLSSVDSKSQAGAKVQTQIATQIEIEEERFYNGQTFAQLCVDASGRISTNKFTSLGLQHVSHDRYCLSDPSMNPGDLRAAALQAILVDILRQYDPKLGALTLAQITKSNALTNITIADVAMDTAKNEYCLRVEADLDPVAAMAALAALPDAPTTQHAAAPPQQPKYLMTLDLSTLPAGQPMASYGPGVAVATLPTGKAIVLNGLTEADALVESLAPPPAAPAAPATAAPAQAPAAPATAPTAAPGAAPAPPTWPFVPILGNSILEFTATVRLNYDVQLDPSNAPLVVPLVEVIYQDWTRDRLTMMLEFDDTKHMTVQYNFGLAQTNPKPYPRKPAPTEIQFVKQDNTLKLLLNQNFIVSIPSANRPLRAFNVRLFNKSALLSLRLEANEFGAAVAPSKPAPGTITPPTFRTADQIMGQKPGPAPLAPAAPKTPAPAAPAPATPAPAPSTGGAK